MYLYVGYKKSNMSEKDKVYGSKIKSSGIFDFRGSYEFLYVWLKEEGYEVEEAKYVEKVGGDGKKTIEIEWGCSKKVSDYFKNFIKVEWMVTRMTDTEVEIEGKKQSMNKGDIQIKVGGVLVKDYENSWEGKPWLKFLRGLYEKFIIPSRISAYEGKVAGDSEELLEQMKAFWQLTGRK